MFSSSLNEKIRNMTLPNKLTLMRIFLVPFIILIALFPYQEMGINLGLLEINGIYYISIKHVIMVVLFVIASITDFIDGYIARRDNLITTFGQFMDPIADKLLVNSLLVLLAVEGLIPVLAVIIMIGRDTIVDALRLIASQNRVVLAASGLGKAKTISQMVAITFTLLQNLPFEMMGLPVTTTLIWLATAISLVSGIDYFIKNIDYILKSM